MSMSHRFYLNASHHFAADPQHSSEADWRRQLKQQHGIDARRLSRFTQLALLGALPLRAQLPPNPAIFLASPFSSPSKIIQLRHKLDHEGLPSPLDFMANLHNAATFHLAQILGSHGNSAFIAVDNPTPAQALYPALNHLLAHPQDSVLCGWVYERQQEGEAEGSLWWQLSGQPHPHTALRLRFDPNPPDTAPFPTPPDTAFYPHILSLYRHLQQHTPTVLSAHGVFPPLVFEQQ